MQRQHRHGATAAQCSSNYNQRKVCHFTLMLLATLLLTKRLQLQVTLNHM
jgi:hypothetical protein